MADTLDRLKTALQGRYTIERELGTGGMATVYLAEDLKHHRKVAVKVLRPDLAAALGPERFLQEIEIAAQLQHPHILPLYDSGRAVRRYGGTAVEEQGEFLYYVMPYVDGPSLRDKLTKEGELPIAEAVRILRDVVDALSEAHAHGVVHRDIKPENILLRGRHALVTDFGVAKAVSEATGREQLTTAGIALGTPAYMAPEQASADPHLDQRVDIYAVGAVAYELLTGRPVFMGTTPQMILSAHMTEPPQPVTKHRDTVPAALESVVMRCLEKRPADRWQSAEELLPQLEALATPSGGVTPTDTRPMAGIASKRRGVVPTAAAVAVLCLVIVVLWQMLTPNPITITTSNIRPVTSEPGVEERPALSPDGARVAFLANRGGRHSVVIRSSRGTGGAAEIVPAQAEQGGSVDVPVWSPDGEFLRFFNLPHSQRSFGRDGSWREVAMLGGQARLIDLPGDATYAAWSPDGSRVVFFKDLGNDSIFTYSVNDRTTTLLAVAPIFIWGLNSPVWSPDGRRVAYAVGNPWWETGINESLSSIWIVEADGGDPVRVTGENSLDVSPTWLNENHLMFISNREGLREVYVVEVGPAGPRGEPRKVPGATDARSISYSIEGRKLAFSKGTARQNVWSYPIWSGAVSIRDGHPVTSENALIQDHDISADGEWIVYNSNLRGNANIYKRRLDGGSPVPITDSPYEERMPRWSPDGTEILFIRPVGDSYRVMVVPADGGIPNEVVTSLFAMWSPSGLEIAFTTQRTGQREVWIVTRDSIGGEWGEDTQLTESNLWLADWSPDGSGLLCIPPWPSDEMVVVSRDGEVSWRYDLAAVGLRWGGSLPRFSRDGSTIYVQGLREDGVRGVWAISMRGGEPSLLVESAEFLRALMFSAGPDRLYVTVAEHESDIWVMDVEVER